MLKITDNKLNIETENGFKLIDFETVTKFIRDYQEDKQEFDSHYDSLMWDLVNEIYQFENHQDLTFDDVKFIESMSIQPMPFYSTKRRDWINDIARKLEIR